MREASNGARCTFPQILVGCRTSCTHANLARLRQTLRDILRLLDGAADEFLEQRDLDGLSERMLQSEFCPGVSFRCGIASGLAYIYEDPLRRVMTSLYILLVSSCRRLVCRTHRE